MMDKNCETYPATFITYTSDEISEMSMTQANITNTVDKTYAAWLTEPSKNIEKEWDAYVKSVQDIGLTDNLKTRQTAYERYLAEMEK